MERKQILIANTAEDSLSLIDLKENYRVDTVYLLDLVKKLKNPAVWECSRLGPLTMAFSQEGNILIANSYDNSIMKLDMTRMDIVGFVRVGKNPTGIDSYGNKIYVVNSDSNSVSVIDNESFTIVEEIPVGEKPTDIKIDKDKAKAYVANSNCYTISLLDLKGNKTDHIPLGKQPIRLILEDGSLFVLSYINDGNRDLSNLTEIAREDHSIKYSIDLKGIFYNIVKINKEKIFYLTSTENGFLYKLNVKEDKGINLKRIYLGGMPNHIIGDGEEKIYISNILNNRINIININRDQITKNLRVGREPNGILLL